MGNIEGIEGVHRVGSVFSLDEYPAPCILREEPGVELV